MQMHLFINKFYCTELTGNIQDKIKKGSGKLPPLSYLVIQQNHFSASVV